MASFSPMEKPPTVIWEHVADDGTRGRRLTTNGEALIYEEFSGKATMGEPIWIRVPWRDMPAAAIDALAARVLPKPEDEILAEQALARAVGLSGHHRVTVLEAASKLLAEYTGRIATLRGELELKAGFLVDLRKACARSDVEVVDLRDRIATEHNSGALGKLRKALGWVEVDQTILPSFVMNEAAKTIGDLRKTEGAAVDEVACLRGELSTMTMVRSERDEARRVLARTETLRSDAARDRDLAVRELEAWKAKQPIERNRQLEIFVGTVAEVTSDHHGGTAARMRLHAGATRLINQRNGPLPRRKLLPKGSARVVKAAREWLWVTPKPTTDEERALSDAVRALPPEAP